MRFNIMYDWMILSNDKDCGFLGLFLFVLVDFVELCCDFVVVLSYGEYLLINFSVSKMNINL